MTSPETEFERELKVFGNEVDEAIQSFYAEQTVHNVARGDSQVFQVLNRHAAFWNLATRALQSNALIVLGRIFDTNAGSHGVDRLLDLAQTNSHMFSKAAFEKRIRPRAGEWTKDYMRDVYVPTPRDFKRLRRYADRQRTIYKNKYKVLRDKIVAHRDRADMAGFIAKTSIRELEQLMRFLSLLHDALWELYTNGRKPSLRPVRYSARQILKLPKRLRRNSAGPEWITGETEKFLKYVARSEETRTS